MRKSTLREYVESLLFSIVAVLFVRAFLTEAVQVPTGSMEDTLLPGDHLFINKFSLRALERGPSSFLPYSWVHRKDIVIFKFIEDSGEPRYYVKRVIGLPGETIEIRAKQVYVDGAPLDEPYALFKDPDREHLAPRDDFGPVEVPPGHLFVLGDNRDHSYDSRYWGFLSHERVIGRPLFVWWSFDEELSSGTDPAGGLADVLTRFFRQTRWGRTGMSID